MILLAVLSNIKHVAVFCDLETRGRDSLHAYSEYKAVTLYGLTSVTLPIASSLVHSDYTSIRTSIILLSLISSTRPKG